MERRRRIFSKNIIIAGAAVLAVALTIFLFFSYIMIVFMGFSGVFLPNPKAPDVLYGEFDFKLSYTVNGEEYFVQDTLVCEYDGVGIFGGGKTTGEPEKKISWKGYIKSTGDKMIEAYSDDRVELQCYIGSAGYLMGDPEYDYGVGVTWRLYDKKKGWYRIGTLENADICEVKLVNFEIDEPIENSFKYTLKSIFAPVKFE